MRSRTAVLLATTLALAATGRAEPQKQSFALRLAAGDRIERSLVHESSRRVEESAVSARTTRETIDAWICVDAVAPAERLTVETPRAVVRTTLGGAGPAPVPTDAHGSTVRYEVVGGSWKATPVGGPTPKDFANWLASGVDPLRRALVPAQAMAVGETAELAGKDVEATLRRIAPVPLLAVESVLVRFEGVSGKDDDAVARLRGVVRCRALLTVSTFGDTETSLELDLAEEIALSDGLLRSLSLRGKTIVYAKAGASSARVDVTIDSTETAAKRPASWTPTRHADAWVAPATLVPEFDGRAWAVASHSLLDGKWPQSLTEWSPAGEKSDGTDDGWTERIAVQRIRPPGGKNALVAVFDSLKDHVGREAPGASWKCLSQTADDLTYQWTLRGDRRMHDRHELGRLVRFGDDSILQVRYTKKVARLPDDERSAWLARLAAAKIVGAR